MQYSSAVPAAATTGGFNTPRHNLQRSPACRQDQPDSLPMSLVNCVCKQGKVSCHSQCLRSSPPIDLVCFLHLDLSPVPPHNSGITGTTITTLLPPPSRLPFHWTCSCTSPFDSRSYSPFCTSFLPMLRLKANR
jgi:hypothetical protein